MAKRVPAKLHSELAEYASLLRALRVRDAMDVTKHLTQQNPFALNTAHDAELASDDDDVLDDASSASLHPPSTILLASRSTSASPDPDKPKSVKARGKQKAGSVPPSKKKKKVRRDHWTRWPLLLDDVLTPEWSLEDEVAVIVSQFMKGRPSPVFPVPVAEPGDAEDEEPMYAGLDLEYDEEDPDLPFYVPYITAVIANYLSTTLAALACHIPARTAGFQNRIEPLGWRTIIDVLVACAPSEFVNPKIVENVINRMEAIYGPSIIPLEGEKSTSLRAVERINAKTAALKRFNARIDAEAAMYWKNSAIMLPPAEGQPSECPSRKKRKRSRTEDQEVTEPTPATSKAPRKRRRTRKSNTEDEEAPTEEDNNNATDEANVVAAAEGPEQDRMSAEEPTEEENTVRRSTRERITRQFNFPTEDVFIE